MLGSAVIKSLRNICQTQYNIWSSFLKVIKSLLKIRYYSKDIVIYVISPESFKSYNLWNLEMIKSILIQWNSGISAFHFKVYLYFLMKTPYVLKPYPSLINEFYCAKVYLNNWNSVFQFPVNLPVV